MHHRRRSVRIAGTACATLVTAAFALGAQATTASSPDVGTARPWSVGRQLNLNDQGPLMQPERVPANVDLIAARPGATGAASQEVWAAGHVSAPSARPGYQNGGRQGVFLHHTAAGWEESGPPMRSDGVTVAAVAFLSMSVAANGEGWAVGAPLSRWTPDPFVLLHHVPGAAIAWQMDDDASQKLAAAVNQAAQGNWYPSTVTLSIGSPGEGAGGTYGFAVIGYKDTRPTTGTYNNAGGIVLDLSNGTWSQESQQLSGPVSSVATVSGDEAWAVGSAYSVALMSCAQQAGVSGSNGTVGSPAVPQGCLTAAQNRAQSADGSGIFHRSGGRWTPVQVGNVPYPVQNGSATGVAVDGSDVWIGGVTGADQPSGIPAPIPAGAQTGTQNSAPYIVHLPAAGAAVAYCDQASSYPSSPTTPSPTCQGSLPAGRGIGQLWPVTLATAPSPGGHAVVFAAAGPAGSLFRFDGGDPGGWTSQPATMSAILVMSFSSPDEGWVGQGPVIGHWTTHPTSPRVHRWPTPSGSTLAAVAADPSGSGRLLAVGTRGRTGAVASFDPGTGLWVDLPLPAGADALEAISWPSRDEAWAVGGRTLLRWDGHVWRATPVQGGVPGALHAVAVNAGPLAQVARVASSFSVPAGQRLPEAASAATLALASWGGGIHGELGTGSTTATFHPSALSALHGVVGVSAGGSAGSGQAHTLAVACPCPAAVAGKPAAGTVYAWGSNASGQLGQESTTSPSSSTPLPVKFPAAAGDMVAVAAGARHSLALAADGAVWAWGDDTYGELGDGNATGLVQATPVKVLALSGVVAIAAGPSYSLAVESDGSAWAWGDNTNAQLGGGTPLGQAAAPLRIASLTGVTQVAAGGDHALAVAGGVVYAWGSDAAHQVNNGCLAAQLLEPCGPGQVLNLPSGAPTAIAAGAQDSFAVIGGRLWAWGHGEFGEVGTGGGAPAPVGGLGTTPVVGVTAGLDFTLAAEQDGSPWAWGNNASGQLGASPQSVKTSATPLRVAGLAVADAASPGHLAAGMDQSLATVDASVATTTPTPTPSAPPPPPGPGGPAPLVGYAVGDNGTALRYDGGQWVSTGSPTQQTLRAVAATPVDFVAVGDDGVILVDGGPGLATAAIPPATANVDPNTGVVTYPALRSAAGLSDGTVLIGGDWSVLLQRDSGSPALSFGFSSLPALEAGWGGGVRALAARRDAGGRLHAVAVVGDEGSGWLLDGDASGWRDPQLADVTAGGVVEDWTLPISPLSRDGFGAQRDAVHGMALVGGGYSGWAVGDRGSIWRMDLNLSQPGLPDYHPGGVERSPMELGTTVVADPTALASFAYLANTGCLQGNCLHQLGWGSRGDVIATEALRAIDASARTGGPRFVAGGGDLRRLGDSSLSAMPALLNSLSIPVYEALGAKDLDGSTSPATTWARTFAQMPAPWGTSGPGAPSGITPLASPLGTSPASGQAATHYAFDASTPAGQVRVVVLDTSQGAAGDTNPTTQNPQESQLSWLAPLLQSAGKPVVVLMNQPLVTTGVGNPGDAALTTVLTTTPGVVGVVSSAVAPNQVQSAGSLPVYMFAGGGGRFSTSAAVGQAPADVAHGYYFSWQLASVVPTAGGFGLAVRSIPVLDSVAVMAPQGTSAASGSAIHFTGDGRVPDAGTWDDGGEGGAEFSPRHIGFPFAAASPQVVAPDYHFTSDDNGIIAPVVPDPAHPERPLLVSGQTHLDTQGTAGLFCAFKPGTTTIQLTAGTVAARLPVTVHAGSGSECGPLAPPPPRAPVHVPVKVPPAQPVQAHPAPPGIVPVPAAQPHPHVRPHVSTQNLVGGVVPPPAEVVPAPPGGGGVGESAGQREKEEESEAAMENANMTALRHQHRMLDDWLPLGGAALGTGLAAYCMARGRWRRAGPVRAAVVTLGASPWRRR